MARFGHRLRLTTLVVVAFAAVAAGAEASEAAPARSGIASGKDRLGVTSSIAKGAHLAGRVVWTASPTAPVSKVDFLIDGSVRWSAQSAPYQYNGPGGVLDTTAMADGSHTFVVRAYATRQTASATSSATVSNSLPTPAPPPPPASTSFAVSSSINNRGYLSGTLPWTATTNASTSKIEFSIDGTLRWTENVSPYQFDGDPNGTLDTTALADGTHVLGLTAYASDGRIASRTSSVTVSNAASPAPVSSPPPTTPPFLGNIPRFGISTGYTILTRSAADRAYELDQIQAVGAKIVRFDSTPGNQSQVDATVAAVLARGMEPMLILFGTTPPVSAATAAAFASSQATKWRGRVRLYEFTNEPDLNGWTGASYAQSLIPTYDAIKAADPSAVVIAGALWKGAGGPVQFVTDMYNAGAKGHFDILSLHLYDDALAIGSWNIWNMAFQSTPSVRSVMDAHGDTAIPIGATEAGGPVSKYGEDGQATIVSHDFDALASDPRIAFVCVYSMMDDDVPGFGLLRPDRSQRPAWGVYRSRAT